MNKWHDRYKELKDYIAQNPKVELGQEVIAIPQEYRPEFYRRFDVTRSAFVEEKFPELLEWAKSLSQSYLQAEKEIMKNPALSEIKLPPYVRWFATNPVDGLRRVLYDPLFDLLRDRISIEQFTSQGYKSIPPHNDRMAAQCYQYWLAISLTNLLKPKQFYSVNLNVGSSSVAIVEAMGHKTKPVREPEETDTIPLGQSSRDIFVINDIITYSTRIKRWVAFKAGPTIATWTAENASENVEWIEILKEELMPELLLVNTGDKVEDIALLRDSEKIVRPELALVCLEPYNWHEKGEYWRDLQFTRDVLNPKLGTHVASRPEIPEEVTKKLEFDNVLSSLSDQEAEESAKGIQVTNISLDTSRLEQYVDMLASQG